MNQERRPPAQQPPASALFPLIVQSLHEGVFTVDEQFRITSFNPAAARITGVPAERAIGRRCHEVFRAAICQSDCALKQTVRTGAPLRDVRIDVLDQQERSVPIRVSTAVLKDASGQLLGGVEIFRDVSEVESLRQQVEGHSALKQIIGASQPMQEIFRVLPEIAASDATVLVEGPSGTGKELVARAIHQLSPRRDKPFIRVNCAALPDTLLESELFGYVKGAFTDARKDKAGRFTQAHGGTLLLDEIGDVSPAFQAKLLRVLQEGEVQPLGSTRTIRVDVRVIAATNRDLAQLVRERQFREDLYYRVRVVPLRLPPLKERREDIPLLVERFMGRLSAKTGRAIGAVAPEALAALLAYDFPGNVRELENLIERAFVHCTGSRLEVACLGDEFKASAARRPVLAAPPASGEPAGPAPGPDPAAGPGSGCPAPAEHARVLAALEAHRWARADAAQALGMGRNTLWRKMKRHRLL